MIAVGQIELLRKAEGGHLRAFGGGAPVPAQDWPDSLAVDNATQRRRLGGQVKPDAKRWQCADDLHIQIIAGLLTSRSA